MGRERRLEYSGAVHHVMARGNRRGEIVRDNADRWRFVETLQEVVESSGLSGRDPGADRQKGYNGPQTRDHGKVEARRIIALAEEKFALRRTDWTGLKEGHWRKEVAAGLVRKRSLVDHGWLAEQLQTGARNSVSHTIRQAREFVAQNRAARQAAKRLESNAERS